MPARAGEARGGEQLGRPLSGCFSPESKVGCWTNLSCEKQEGAGDLTKSCFLQLSYFAGSFLFFLLRIHSWAVCFSPGRFAGVRICSPIRCIMLRDCAEHGVHTTGFCTIPPRDRKRYMGGRKCQRRRARSDWEGPTLGLAVREGSLKR